MNTGVGQDPDATVPGTVAQALRMTIAGLDFLNSPAAGALDGAACGEVLTALSEIRAKFTAAHATFLRRFDATDAHDADGCASSSAWLASKTGMTKKDARAAVRQMRRLAERPQLHDALAAGRISQSWADAIADWTRMLPVDLRARTDRILLDAAAAGASLDDLATIAGCAIEKWRSGRPDADADEDAFRDRYLKPGTTFGGAGVIRGDLTPGCAAAVQAVLEALGKKRGPEDGRTQEQRFHDALAEACKLLIRARMVPGRAGADTQAIVHIPIDQLRQMPGASEIERAWINARIGEPGYLAGTDAEVAACDAMTVPVVTGHADMTVIDRIIQLAVSAAGGRPGGLSPEAARALRYSVARLAVGFVSGPNGLASALRTGLLRPPFATPSLPLDIGVSDSIPAQIRRAVMLRDRHCRWPGGCDRPASASDVHHIIHKRSGGETSIGNCAVFCEFHHETCIHRWGWRVILHPDGTMEARSPDGSRVIRESGHSPPATRAA